MQLLRPKVMKLISLVLLFVFSDRVLATPSIAREWNEEILSAIRRDRPNPPVHARNLFHLGVVMYNAWAAYDAVAVGYIHHERQTAIDIALARREAISYAAYRMLKSCYATSVSAGATGAALDAHMATLGYPVSTTSTVGNSPAELGNRIAADIIAWRIADGSNQAGGYDDPLYLNTQPPMVVRAEGLPMGGIPLGTNPTKWQPLAFDLALDQDEQIAALIQNYVGLTWLKTLPFSLERIDPALPWINVGSPSLLNWTSSTQATDLAADSICKQQVLAVLRASSQLNGNTLLDISPGDGGTGNNPLGTDAGTGHAVNPVTGQPYETNFVKVGDFSRVLAEFWADGPASETPPGHWHVLANQMTDHPLTEKRIGGSGPAVDDLEWDVKMYFALSAATHDAACAAWSLKRYYEGVRPITLIRYMGEKGQSSDPSGPSYHPQGLLLESGVVEVITAITAAPGGRHEGVGSTGEVVVLSWPGEPAIPTTQQSPVRWIRALDWVPYQRSTFNTPAFPGYVSGHSTFSRAAAEVLTSLTGSAFFPGGLGVFNAPANTYLFFERGPSATVQLQWATYFDAADQAGRSRCFGGIHVPEDDHAGRIAGSECGKRAWDLARKYFDGSILTEIPKPQLALTGIHQGQLEWQCKRGLYYCVETSTDLINWNPGVFTRAKVSATTSAVAAPSEGCFYRIAQKAGP